MCRVNTRVRLYFLYFYRIHTDKQTHTSCTIGTLFRFEIIQGGSVYHLSRHMNIIFFSKMILFLFTLEKKNYLALFVWLFFFFNMHSI